MRFLANLLIILTIGLAGGGFSAKWAVESEHGFGAVIIDGWISRPLAGSVDADPYTKAWVAREGIVPLGAAEGLAFQLMQDNSGNPLRRECHYTLSGTTPPARFWTLSAQDEKRRTIKSGNGGTGAFFSQTLLRSQDGSFAIDISSQPASGNWMTITGSGQMRLVLRLYDTPITGSAGLVEPVMPRLVTKACQS